jgi:hypothetical protein
METCICLVKHELKTDHKFHYTSNKELVMNLLYSIHDGTTFDHIPLNKHEMSYAFKWIGIK